MAKPELGTKRLCSGCSLKFYDLHKTPIVCPTCDTVFDVPKPLPVRPRRAFEPNPVPPPQTTATLEASDADVLDEEDSDDKDDDDKETDAKKAGDDESASGVPMLEEMDEE